MEHSKFEIPSEMEIVDCFCNVNCEIFTYEDVHNFLINNAPNKAITDRFISWCVSFKLIPFMRQRWGTTFYKAVTQYSDKIHSYFGEKMDDPLSTISMNLENAIKPEMEKAKEWFKKGEDELCLRKNFVVNPKTRISRIYALLVNETRNFEYTDGTYVFGAMFLLVSSIYAELVGLKADFAGAIAYYLTRALLSLLPAKRLMNSHQKLTNHFENVIQMLKCYGKEHYNFFIQHNVNLFKLGMNFELFLYTKQHYLIELMNLWDQIFARIEFFSPFVQCLTIAHLTQIKIREDINDINEYIDNYKDFNTAKIINDSISMLNHKRSIIETTCFYLCPKLNKYHGYEPLNDLF